MSYRIVYDQVAVKFTAAQLASHCPTEHGRDDYFMLLELGGANNMWDSSGARARSWDLIGADREWSLMRKVVEYAASCEGDEMRFSNARSTQAETYIRKNRSTLERALTPDGFCETGIGVSASIRVPRTKLRSWQRERLAKLEALMTPQGDSDYALWDLSPFEIRCMLRFSSRSTRSMNAPSTAKRRFTARQRAGSPCSSWSRQMPSLPGRPRNATIHRQDRLLAPSL